MTNEALASISLRDRKMAQARLALLDAALARLEHEPFEAIRVRDLCAAVPVSEASFFNYFGTKSDLLVFFIQLWSLDVAWHARAFAEDGGGLGVIEKVFEQTAREAAEHPRIMGEIIAFQARREGPVNARELTLAERLLRFPDRPGVETLPARGLDVILRHELARAVQRGELPRTTDTEVLLVALCSLFFGTPAVLRDRSPHALGRFWQKGLSILWAGAGAAEPAAHARSTRNRA